MCTSLLPKSRPVIVERDVYADKDAVIDVGDVVFEGETESTADTDFSNPLQKTPE